MTRKKKTEVEEIVTAYKGFKQDLTCRGYQFEIGGTYKHEGEVEACASGFHSCEYPLDVFGYYAPGDSRFAIVKASGQLSRHDDDSKIASATLVVEAEISMPTMISRALDWIMSKVDKSVEQTVVGGTASNTGDYSAASNTGNRSQRRTPAPLGSVEHRLPIGSVEHRLPIGSVEHRLPIGSVEHRRLLGSVEHRQPLLGSVEHRATRRLLGSVEHRQPLGSVEHRLPIGSVELLAASNTGNYSAASNTGNYSAASNTGNYSAAEVSGQESVAASLGIEGRARASAGSAIVLCHRDDEGHLIHIRASKVGENGVKPDTWYQLSAEGEFVEFDE